MNFRPFVLVAVAACGNAKQPSSPPSPDPAKVAGAKPSEAAPEPAPEPPTFMEIVNAAAFDPENAEAVGTSVEAYLVTRYGSPTPQDGQLVDLSLVLLGNGAAIRYPLDTIEVVVDKPRPFGTMTVTTPLTGTFDPEEHAFLGAPKWKVEEPVLIADTLRNLPGDVFAFVLTQEQDDLVVWFAEDIWEDASSTKWTRDLTVPLAIGAKVSAPTATAVEPAASHKVAVRVHERVVSEGKGHRWYDVELEVGGRAGPIAMPTAEIAGDRGWVFDATGLAPAALAARVPELGAALPRADVFHAHRVYGKTGWVQNLVLGRVGDELIVWERADDGSPGAAWVENVRVPLPAGANLAVQQ